MRTGTQAVAPYLSLFAHEPGADLQVEMQPILPEPP
jgi:hypothetical protein